MRMAPSQYLKPSSRRPDHPFLSSDLPIARAALGSSFHLLSLLPPPSPCPLPSSSPISFLYTNRQNISFSFGHPIKSNRPFKTPSRLVFVRRL
ncbi:hypothetical protein POX_e07088 [Penicillium oxalicum]|uniref:hypothetical protein n=1 Tax=Penicillium oxalicum TaxID=69781 RepID=UPI0020B7DF88|nr:hypothetical protein POX_e07088 [Penicillium oxalicum]KAI2789061.1 hypothetical protein POX_e07088 [Penicillium oxalicum]